MIVRPESRRKLGFSLALTVSTVAPLLFFAARAVSADANSRKRGPTFTIAGTSW